MAPIEGRGTVVQLDHRLEQLVGGSDMAALATAARAHLAWPFAELLDAAPVRRPAPEPAEPPEPPGPVLTEVEVGLLQHQAHALDEGQGRRGPRERAVEEAVERVLAERGAQLTNPVDVALQVPLLLVDHRGQSPPKGERRLGPAQQAQRHQLDGQQLVVGEVVQQRRPGPGVRQRPVARLVWPLPARGEAQRLRSSGRLGREAPGQARARHRPAVQRAQLVG